MLTESGTVMQNFMQADAQSLFFCEHAPPPPPHPPQQNSGITPKLSKEGVLENRIGGIKVVVCVTVCKSFDHFPSNWAMPLIKDSWTNNIINCKVSCKT